MIDAAKREQVERSIELGFITTDVALCAAAGWEAIAIDNPDLPWRHDQAVALRDYWFSIAIRLDGS